MLKLLIRYENFSSLKIVFKRPSSPSTGIGALSFHSLSQSQHDYLELPFSRDEIKRAVWDCGGDRAPGPDGFTFNFFTTFWDIIEKDVVRFVQEFSTTHEIPKGSSDQGDFELLRVLLQGDPLSPFLFILAMEGLHSLTYKAEELGLFTGLKINIDKSSVLGVGVSVEENAHMARIIGCGVSNLPFKYLGIPVGCNMSRCVHWNAVIQSFTSKLSSWKARLLSVGGRLLLIKAVLVKRLKEKGIDLLSLCSRKLGNGESTRFLDDSSCGNSPLKVQFPRVYNLDTDRNCTIANRIPLIQSNWCSVFRRSPRGGAEMNQFEALKAAIGDVILSDQSDSWVWVLMM
ncbi:hypothetical protein Tco_1039189 [Tanacetum coccineum]